MVNGAGHSLCRRKFRLSQGASFAGDLCHRRYQSLAVARHYMHLKHEKAIIYAIAIVPVAFVIIFLIGLFPDFVYHTTKP